MFHVSLILTWSKSMKQCQWSETYRCGETKKEIKMPYSSDTPSWYSKYNKISYYIVTCNEYLWWIFGLEYTDSYNTNVTITEVVTLLSWICQLES